MTVAGVTDADEATVCRDTDEFACSVSIPRGMA